MSAPLPKKIVFSGNHRTDYIKASALMDSIRTLGRECEWALKVDKHKLQSCVTFLSKLGPGGEFAQITDHVTELNKNQEQAGVNIDEIRLLTRHLEAVVRYKEFALAKLEVSR